MLHEAQGQGLKERFLLLLSCDRLIFFTVYEVKVFYFQQYFFGFVKRSVSE